MMCNKCLGLSGVLMLALGVVYLLVDLGVWAFWGISWFTAAFLLLGVMWLGKSSCQGCCGLQCSMPMDKKAKPASKKRRR